MTVSGLSLEDKQILDKAYARLGEANAILNFLGQHFQEKYKLTPQNYITPDGEIHTREQSPDGFEMMEVPV